MDNTIHRINHYPVDSVVCSVNVCPLDSKLSGEQRYPPVEQLRLIALTTNNLLTKRTDFFRL